MAASQLIGARVFVREDCVGGGMMRACVCVCVCVGGGGRSLSSFFFVVLFSFVSFLLIDLQWRGFMERLLSPWTGTA